MCNFKFVIIQKCNIQKKGVEGGTHRERKKWHRLFLNKATMYTRNANWFFNLSIGSPFFQISHRKCKGLPIRKFKALSTRLFVLFQKEANETQRSEIILVLSSLWRVNLILRLLFLLFWDLFIFVIKEELFSLFCLCN